MTTLRFAAEQKSLLEWAESEVLLPLTTSHPGPLKLTAPQRGILGAYERRTTRQLTLVEASQLGKSMKMLVILGYHMAVYPLQIFFAFPSRETHGRFVQEKLWPLINANDVLRMKTAHQAQGRTPSSIDYTDGMVIIGYAGSKAMMVSATAELVIADELDLFRPKIQDPLSVLEQRTKSYQGTAKIVVCSTPTLKGSSAIWEAYEAGSQGKWLIPCPHCVTEFEITWECIETWIEDEVEGPVRRGKLNCPSCGEHVTDEGRWMQIEKGRWEHQRPDSNNQSFHLSRLYSPYMTMNEIAADLKPDGSNEEVFTNNTLALPYEKTINMEDAAEYVDKAYRLPPQPWKPNILTMSCDVQGDRLEVQTMEWDGFIPHVKEHRIFRSKDEVAIKLEGTRIAKHDWGSLADLIKQRQPDLCFIDAGFATRRNRARLTYILALRNPPRDMYISYVVTPQPPPPAALKSSQGTFRA